jgi:microcystin-dependent protein
MSDTDLSEVVSSAVAAAVSQTLQTIYPVGAYYISESATNPATLFGFGTWELLTDRTLMGAGSSYAVGAQGGEATHTLTVAEMPSHTHSRGTMEISGFFSATVPDGHSGACSGAFTGGNFAAGYNGAVYNSGTVSASTPLYGYSFAASRNWTGETTSRGGGTAFSTISPYRAVYIFRRTA